MTLKRERVESRLREVFFFFLDGWADRMDRRGQSKMSRGEEGHEGVQERWKKQGGDLRDGSRERRGGDREGMGSEVRRRLGRFSRSS